MIEENVAISNASYESGYNNLSHFNYQFKRIMNVTPPVFIGI